MKNFRFILASVMAFGFFASCSSKTPTLCDCLTDSKYAQYGDSNYKKCQEVFKDHYGTSDPSLDQMRDDYNECKSKQ